MTDPLDIGGGKSDWLAQWQQGKDALWVNERPNGDRVLLSRKSRFEALTAGDQDEKVMCNVMHITDTDEERRIAFEIQDYEMAQGWA